MNQKDYYRILGIAETAGADDIRKAYRNLAFRYHPDRNAGNEEMMKEINEAYAVLSNPSKKSEYDALRQRYGSFARDRFRQTHADQDIFRDSDISQIFEELSKAFGFSGPEDLFSRANFYGPNYRTFQVKRPGFSGSAFFMYGPMRKAYQQQQKAGRGRSVRSTMTIKGLNLFQKIAAKKLGIDLPENGKDWYDVVTITPEQSSGGKIRYIYKKSAVPRELLIKIPPGTRDGRKIRLRGLGQEGKHGGTPGDLYLTVKVRTPFLQKIRKMLLNR
jgi:DnaJ-class molecular chaperone